MNKTWFLIFLFLIFLTPTFNVNASEYYYDSEGRVIKIISGSSTTEYTYDSQGNTTSEINSYNNAINGKTEYVYDSNGNKISQTYYAPYNGSLTPVYKSEYTYDDHNNPTSQSFYEGVSAIAQNTPSTTTTSYTYDSNGNMISKQGGSGYWNNYEYTYDSNGNQTSAIGYHDSEQSVKHEWTYDENGRQTSSITYYYDNYIQSEGWVEKQTFEYDQNGNLINRKDYISYNGVPSDTPSGQTTYAYDQNGNKILEDNGFSKYEWGYDEHGNQIWADFYNSPTAVNSGTPSSHTEYSYDYDKYGNITAVYRNGVLQGSKHYDSAYLNKQWLGKRKLIYTVEEATKLSKPTGNTFKLRYK